MSYSAGTACSAPCSSGPSSAWGDRKRPTDRKLPLRPLQRSDGFEHVLKLRCRFRQKGSKRIQPAQPFRRFDEMALSLSKGQVEWSLRRNGPEHASGASLSKGPGGSTISAWFYILRLSSGALYVGATTDVDVRFAEHVHGKASRMTRLDPPVSIVWREELPSYAEARRREAQVKKWSKAKKEALVAGQTAKLRALARSRNP